MPSEYKKHQWLIYGACNKLKTVGFPLMVTEAQASGVGVIMYDLFPYVKKEILNDVGYTYQTHEQVLDIIKNPFDEDKRQKGIELSSRYNIKNNIDVLF